MTELWVWIGNSETDTLDVLRYAKANKNDVLSHHYVAEEIKRLKSEVERLKSLLPFGDYSPRLKPGASLVVKP